MKNFEVLEGDCFDVLDLLEQGSVDSVVTSPPYAEQRKDTYGGVSERDYPDWTVSWMRKVREVLRPEGSVILNISPHVKQGALSDYVLHTRLELRKDGWVEPDELIWVKPNAMPTGPPDKPRRSWEHLLWFSLSTKPFCNPKANGKAPTSVTNVRNTTAAKEGWRHHQVGANSTPEVTRCTNIATFPVGERNNGYRHPAPFPTALAAWCVRLITPVAGTVLDPFSGSGTTGIAAYREGMSYIGVEKDPKYVAMSQERFLDEA